MSRSPLSLFPLPEAVGMVDYELWVGCLAMLAALLSVLLDRYPLRIAMATCPPCQR